MRGELNEAGSQPISQSENAIDEVISRALASIEAAIMRDDLRKFWAKAEILRHGRRPFCHFLRRIDAVMRCVEFETRKLFSIPFGPTPLDRLLWIDDAAPRPNGPHGSSRPNFNLSGLRL